jgi:Leucine-rich repeat (LRR) protein
MTEQIQALTKELLMARTKNDNLKVLKNLNLWGVGFEDVSLVQQMTNIEVLSLSLNRISSLKDFQYCSKLKELYVRRNNIRSVNEVRYLQNLPELKVLWLSENPCAEIPNYRLQVIAILPGLQKLDNQEVSESERQRAMSLGSFESEPK